MRNPLTARRRRFVAATMAAAEQRAENLATERAEQIAFDWIRDADERAAAVQAEAHTQVTALAIRIVDLSDTNTRLNDRCLALLERANQALDAPNGVDLETWTAALDETRARVIEDNALVLLGGHTA